MVLDISEIKIPQYMVDSEPDRKKIDKKIDLIKHGKKLDITLNNNGYLIDGYTRYLAYLELGYKNCHVRVSKTNKLNQKDIKKIETTYLYEKSKGYCYICGRKCNNLDSTSGDENLNPTIDHLIPVSKGGSNSIDNKRLSCYMCNQLKGQFTYSSELVTVIKRELTERGLL